MTDPLSFVATLPVNHGRDGGWADDPNRHCIDQDPDEMVGTVEQQRALAHICQGCPVLEQCKAHGKTETYGLWGGVPEGHAGRPELPGQRKELTFPVKKRTLTEDELEAEMEKARSIVTAAAAEFELDLYGLIVKSNEYSTVPTFAQGRAEAAARVMEDTQLSARHLGELFGGRSQSAIHSILARAKKERVYGSASEWPTALMPCGTEAAYSRHVRADEMPCSPCLRAHRERQRDKKAAA